jgi:aminopeptidase N
VPRGYIVHSQGIERSTPEEMSQGLFRFQIDNPVFFSFAAGRYTVRRKSGTLPIAINLLRPRNNADSYLNGSAQVLNALTREFGRYPHPKFAVLEVPTEAGEKAGFAGASVDGFILANSEFLDKDFNAAYFGHEISHQWWGNLIRVRGGQKGRWMLSEGMAQYGSLRAVEMLEGAAAAERYRRTGYPGYIADQNALGYFTLIAKGTDHRLSDLPPEGDLPRALSNSKGFIVWDMLSRKVGRRRFSLILQKLIEENAYQRITWSNFLKTVEVETGKNLQWFFEQWFERTGAPDYQLDWKQKGRIVRGTISQPAPYYRATLEVEIKGANRRLLKTIEIINGQKEFNWSVPFKVESVILDPSYKVLRWTPEFRTQSGISTDTKKVN